MQTSSNGSGFIHAIAKVEATDAYGSGRRPLSSNWFQVQHFSCGANAPHSDGPYIDGRTIVSLPLPRPPMSKSILSKIISILPFLQSLLTLRVYGYTFDFTSTPTQCGNLSFAISGSDGMPPYRVQLVPFGPSPLSTEVRKIMDLPLNESTITIPAFSFPAKSQFVVLVSFFPLHPSCPV